MTLADYQPTGLAFLRAAVQAVAHSANTDWCKGSYPHRSKWAATANSDTVPDTPFMVPRGECNNRGKSFSPDSIKSL